MDGRTNRPTLIIESFALAIQYLQKNIVILLLLIIILAAVPVAYSRGPRRLGKIA